MISFLLPFQARACDIALLLAVDVSGSVDPAEYRLQMDGLALALEDPVVSEALVRSKAEVALVQWSGEGRQKTTIPWTSVSGFDQVTALAQKVQRDDREWRHFSTAIGGLLGYALGEFHRGPDCRRRVMDISGDGVTNEGLAPLQVLPALRRADIQVNALVIETEGEDLTGYFWENVITGEGAFVVTANSYSEYPERIRQKLIREISKQLTGIPSATPMIR